MLVFFLGFPLASAHPFLLDSEPGQGQNAPAGTIQIITNYSEAVEIGFSELKVYDANGNQMLVKLVLQQVELTFKMLTTSVYLVLIIELQLSKMVKIHLGQFHLHTHLSVQ